MEGEGDREREREREFSEALGFRCRTTLLVKSTCLLHPFVSAVFAFLPCDPSVEAMASLFKLDVRIDVVAREEELCGPKGQESMSKDGAKPAKESCQVTAESGSKDAVAHGSKDALTENASKDSQKDDDKKKFWLRGCLFPPSKRMREI